MCRRMPNTRRCDGRTDGRRTDELKTGTVGDEQQHTRHITIKALWVLFGCHRERGWVGIEDVAGEGDLGRTEY